MPPKLQVELSPSSDCSRLLRCNPTHASITSHVRESRSGFQHTYVFAKALRQMCPDLDLLIHITCRDLPLEMVDCRLRMYKDIGIKRILLISGENYDQDENAFGNSRLGWSFKNSTRMLQWLKQKGLISLFESVAVAGYPSSNHQAQSDAELMLKLSHGADTVYTQCIDDPADYHKFVKLVHDSYPYVDVIPSVPVYKEVGAIRLARKIMGDTWQPKTIEKGAETRPFLDLIEALSSGVYVPPLINICPFNDMILASELVEDYSLISQ